LEAKRESADPFRQVDFAALEAQCDPHQFIKGLPNGHEEPELFGIDNEGDGLDNPEDDEEEFTQPARKRLRRGIVETPTPDHRRGIPNSLDSRQARPRTGTRQPASVVPAQTPAPIDGRSGSLQDRTVPHPPSIAQEVGTLLSGAASSQPTDPTMSGSGSPQVLPSPPVPSNSRVTLDMLNTVRPMQGANANGQPGLPDIGGSSLTPLIQKPIRAKRKVPAEASAARQQSLRKRK